jgi:dTDP-glucose 4,6-dehydratase
MKLVVITGCLGLIGSYVTRKCLSKGWKVYGVDNLTYAANKSFLEAFKRDSNFTFLEEDIAQLKSLPDCDYVINIAAESHVGNSIIDSSDFIETNVNGVKNLLDLIRNKPDNTMNRPIFFHFSTDEVYGDITEGEHVETDPLIPSNPYSASKASSDMLILAWARTYGVKYVIVRPTNNYGEGQYPEKLIPLCVKLLQRGKKIMLHDEGEPIRNWLHAEDTAEAVTTIVESGKVDEIFNIPGDFEQKNYLTVKKIIEAYYNNNVKWKDYVDLNHKRPGQDIRYALNGDKLKQLGWSPTKVFDEEIVKLVEFYKENFKW